MSALRLCLSASLLLLLTTQAYGVEGGAQESSSCLSCHGALTGRLGEPVAAWEGSVHAANAIGCHSCHGGDPTIASMEAMSPERGFLGVPAETEIPPFCGKCHAGVEEDYLQSAHGETLGAGGPQCVTCHGNHAVAVTTLDLINPESCSRCHEYGRAEEIKGALAETDRLITELQATTERQHRLGIATDDQRKQIFAVRNDFHRLFHSVDVQQVVARSGEFQQRLQPVAQELQATDEELSQRRLIGAGAVLLLALVTVLLGFLRHTYKKEEQSDPGAGSGPL
ncbi:MAG: cytochrome c3 family protein [Desulfuromonadales bacterium]|nr:cytochrome c3 family protein [Desulfuromonadales bacterium]